MAFEFALASIAILSTITAILLLHLVQCGKKKKEEIKPRTFQRDARQQAMDKGDIVAKPHDYPTMEDVKSVWNTVGAGDDDAKDSDVSKPDSKKDGAKGKSDRKGKKAGSSEKKAGSSEKKDARKAGSSEKKEKAKPEEQKESEPKPDKKEDKN
ncbi:hypothetical protein AAVH_05660 [Aphelenchoides avenae]|nr:hypothetical protein AAVH_05660 [Aphelenchus avenae]